MKFKTYLSAAALLLCSLSALAADPVSMLKSVSSQMLGQLDQNQGHIDKQVVKSVVNNVLLPHVDLETMSRSVVGREYWNQASAAQRQQFKQAFTNLVIQVYAAPLSSYNGETVEFRPMRDSSGSRVQVESIVVRKNGQRIPVSYRLLQSGSSWKVYDFSVEGISMISSYRAQFDTILQQGGMAGLLTRLHAGK